MGPVKTTPDQPRTTLPVPDFDIMATNVCFGSPNLRKAYIASAALGIRYEADWHCPGQPPKFLTK